MSRPITVSRVDENSPVHAAVTWQSCRLRRVHALRVCSVFGYAQLVGRGAFQVGQQRRGAETEVPRANLRRSRLLPQQQPRCQLYIGPGLIGISHTSCSFEANQPPGRARDGHLGQYGGGRGEGGVDLDLCCDWCSLCSLCSLCSVFLCSVFCVLCFFVLCSVFCVLCFVFCGMYMCSQCTVHNTYVHSTQTQYIIHNTHYTLHITQPQPRHTP